MGLTGTMRTHQHLVSGAKIGVFFELWGMNANFDAKKCHFSIVSQKYIVLLHRIKTKQ